MDPSQLCLNVGTEEKFQKGSGILTIQGQHVLEEENFRSRDFWEGYKLYCFGRYSHCVKSKRRFLASKMGRVVNLLQTRKQVPWGAAFDESVRQVWAMMEDYAENSRGQNWRNLRALMEKFDDVKSLSSTENGTLLMQLVEVNLQEDECSTERQQLRCAVRKLNSGNVFDEICGRLKRMGSDLEKLKESSAARGGCCRRFKSKQ